LSAKILCLDNSSNIIKTCKVLENLVLHTWIFSVHFLLPVWVHTLQNDERPTEHIIKDQSYINIENDFIILLIRILPANTLFTECLCISINAQLLNNLCVQVLEERILKICCWNVKQFTDGCMWLSWPMLLLIHSIEKRKYEALK